MIVTEPVAAILAQADTDDRLIERWLHGRPAATQAAYRRDVAAFRAAVGMPIRVTRLRDNVGGEE